MDAPIACSPPTGDEISAAREPLSVVIPTLDVRINVNAGAGWYGYVKRMADIVVGAALLVVLLPLMAAVALLVAMDSPGPIIFRQERIGRNGRPFTLLKFRTMPLDCEIASGPGFARCDHPRPSRLGRLLRRHSPDELPQLLNVVRGDMSLVGPRPERPFFVAQFALEIPRYTDRHRVRPGMTGWAQVNGLRGDTSVSLRTQYDLDYVARSSPWLDLRILPRTVAVIIHDDHAY